MFILIIGIINAVLEQGNLNVPKWNWGKKFTAYSRRSLVASVFAY